MNRTHFRNLHSHLRTLIVLTVCSWTLSVSAQTVTWQILGWPSNQNWPGPQGSPATTNGNQIVLTGQDVLSVQSFTPPATISYDVLLPTKSTTDGIIELYFVPTGEPSNIVPTNDVELSWSETQTGNDSLQVEKDHYTSILWGSVPYPLAAGTTYHVSVNVAADGQVSWAINGADVGLSNSVVVPYPNFQVRLSSWQPTEVWQISNFTVTTAPVLACPNVTGTWTGQVNVVDSRRGYSTTTLSLNVTDQSTNSCLLRGYLSTGSAPRNCAPWGSFVDGGLWGRVPFTGAILDTTGLVINLGIFGQASATLDTTQTPPVMRKFILLSAGGLPSGDTAVGDLTEEPSSP
jgi:hypothetical protein